ncbi:hypothetical protein RHO12_03165 [Orbus sturtevantii]|uniref:DUF7370 family protein n=1 Tax=Orbus sturtevantii TaxID=3074109 RepID=UPI00370D8910
MSIEITLEQAKQQLSSMGFVATDFILESLISLVNTIDGCLDATGYSDYVIKLIKMYSVMLLLSSSDVRKVSSESAPSGASRSYQYFDDGRSSLLSMLSKLDTKECTLALPIVRSNSLLQFNVIRG